MTRLGVISDSHGSQFWTEQFLRRANLMKYDMVFHLGDGVSEARWLEERLDMPIQYVAGNCDLFAKASSEIFASFEGHRLLICHGHQHDVKWGLSNLSYYAESQGADVALYGHTHAARAEFVGPVLTVNPGALRDGRFAEVLIHGERVNPLLKEL